MVNRVTVINEQLALTLVEYLTKQPYAEVQRFIPVLAQPVIVDMDDVEAKYAMVGELENQAVDLSNQIIQLRQQLKQFNDVKVTNKD